MNGAQAELHDAIEAALEAERIAVRRLGVEDARQVAWVAVLDGGEDVTIAVRKALRREARKLGGTVSLDAVGSDGRAMIERIEAVEPAPVEAVSVSAVDRMLATQPEATRELLRQTVLDEAEPSAVWQHEWQLRAYVKTTADRARNVGDRVGLELTALLHGLGIDRLSPDLRAKLSAAVMVAQRHSTEYRRLAEMSERAAAGRAIGLRHPDRLKTLAAQAAGTTTSIAFGPLHSRRPARSVIAARMLAAGLLWRFTDLDRPAIEQAIGLTRGYLGRYLGTDPQATMPTLPERVERDDQFAAAWLWALDAVGAPALRELPARHVARHCVDCGAALHWRTTLDQCTACRGDESAA